jgi:hypothetical protein
LIRRVVTLLATASLGEAAISFVYQEPLAPASQTILWVGIALVLGIHDALSARLPA